MTLRLLTARGVAASLCVLAGLAFVAPAAGQTRGGRLGRGLDDPSGQAPVRPRPEADRPSEAATPGGVPAAPSYTPGARPEAGDDDPDDGAPPHGQLAARARVLNASLQALAARSGPDVLRAVMNMLTGGAEIALGAVLLEVGGPIADSAPYFMVLGGVTVVRSIFVDLILPPDARNAAIDVMAMPAGTRAELLAQVRFAEEQLEGLANQAFITRMVDASFNIAGALAIIPAYLAPRDFMLTSELEALIFIGPGIALISGVVTLASRSAVETRWNTYREMVNRMGSAPLREAEAAPSPAVELSFGGGVDPRGGGALSVSGRF